VHVGETFIRFWTAVCTKCVLRPPPRSPSRYKGEGREGRGRKGLGIGRKGREGREGVGRDGSGEGGGSTRIFSLGPESIVTPPVSRGM